DLPAVGLLEGAHGDARRDTPVRPARYAGEQRLVLGCVERPDVDEDVREAARERGAQRRGGAGDHGAPVGAVMVLAGEQRHRAEPATVEDVELRLGGGGGRRLAHPGGGGGWLPGR